MRTAFFPALIAATALAHVASSAATTNTDLTIQAYEYAYLDRIETPSKSVGFIDTYADSVKSDPSIILRFGPLSQFSWFLSQGTYRYDYTHQIASSGRNAVISMAKNSLRETLLETLPLDEWRDTGEDLWDRFGKNGFIGKFFVDLFAGSLGNTDERSLDLVSASPNDVSMQRSASWWQRVKAENRLEYGQHDAHIYARFDAGHHLGGVPIFHMDLRCGLEFPSFDARGLTKIMKFEEQAILSLPRRWQMVCGISLYPLALGSEYDRPAGSIRLEHLYFKNTYQGGRISGTRFKGMLSLGAWSNGAQTIFNVSMFRMF